MKTVQIQEIESFFIRELDFNKIKSSNLEIVAYNSENDPYVPAEYNTDWEKINTKSIIIKDAGHFNTASGYIKIQFLLPHRPIPASKYPARLNKMVLPCPVHFEAEARDVVDLQ